MATSAESKNRPLPGRNSVQRLLGPPSRGQVHAGPSQEDLARERDADSREVKRRALALLRDQRRFGVALALPEDLGDTPGNVVALRPLEEVHGMECFDLVARVPGDGLETLVPAHEMSALVEEIEDTGQPAHDGARQRTFALLRLGHQQALGHVPGHAEDRLLLAVAEQVAARVEPAQRTSEPHHPVLDLAAPAEQDRREHLAESLPVFLDHQRRELSVGDVGDASGVEHLQPRVVHLNDPPRGGDHQHRLGLGLQVRLQLRVLHRQLEVGLLELHHLLAELARQGLAVFGLGLGGVRGWRAGGMPRRHPGEHLEQALHEDLGLHRLDDESVGAEIGHQLFVAWIGVGGRVDHEGDRRQRRVGLPLAQQIEAVFDRHEQIGNAELGRPGAGLDQRFGAVRGLFDLEARAGQDGAQEVAVRLEVVDDQYAAHVDPPATR